MWWLGASEFLRDNSQVVLKRMEAAVVCVPCQRRAFAMQSGRSSRQASHMVWVGSGVNLGSTRLWACCSLCPSVMRQELLAGRSHVKVGPRPTLFHRCLVDFIVRGHFLAHARWSGRV